MKYNVREGDYRTMGAVVHNDGVVFTFEGRKEQKCSIVLYEKKTGKIRRADRRREDFVLSENVFLL